MELVPHRIMLPNLSTKLYVHLITDVHREAVGCDTRKFKRDIRNIAKWNKNPKKYGLHYWIGGGDWNNGITAKDKRFDATAISSRFKPYVGKNLHKEVAEVLVEEAYPIREWCLGYGRGNHEDGVIRYADFDPADYVAQQLNVNYIGYSAGIRLTIQIEGQLNSQVLVCYWHHGFGAARSKGGKMNMLYQLRDKLMADVYMTGHIHEPLGFPSVRLEMTRKGAPRLKAKPIIFVNGGTYQKAFQADRALSQKPGTYNRGHDVEVDYAEKAAYDPSVIGHFGWSYETHKTTHTDDKGKESSMWAYKLRTVDFR